MAKSVKSIWTDSHHSAMNIEVLSPKLQPIRPFFAVLSPVYAGHGFFGSATPLEPKFMGFMHPHHGDHSLDFQLGNLPGHAERWGCHFEIPV